MSCLPGRLQETLQHLYRIDGTIAVADFRVCREGLTEMLGDDAARYRETLVVDAQEDSTGVALFLCEDVERRAQRFLSGEDELDAICTAIEGVSHFVYFTYCGARQDRPVSMMELELQAEIDKFLVLRATLGLTGRDLTRRLYEQFSLRDGLSVAEAARYRAANRYGRRYARWLDHRFACGRGAEALDNARVLYRRPLAAKLSSIAGARC